MPTKNEIATEVRGRLGDPSEAELPSTQVDRAVDGALREFSRYYPEVVEVSLVLVAGQSEYELPAGSLEVSEAAHDARSPFHPDAMGIPRNAYPGPSDEHFDRWRGLHDDYTVRRDEIEPELQVIARTGQPPVLRIIPTPKHGGTMALVVDIIRDSDSLTETETEGVVNWAEGDCLEYIGRKRSKSVTDIPTATGRLKLSDGKDLRDEGRDQKKDQACSWGVGATVIEGG